ncbi:hypothetical protein DYBT9623_02437 [Dyadobacter sp. CECT 9623]|uniref:DUF4157 domain-containing protein n=1 Tax=Dyadobacter linearis TaxID=2823330 RepID=A0ABN7R6K8_9BACT|nr:hypothetical protein [Dyadobacter sp. CECT 9623]CAG5069700.1 hypothetical protein DYBT9623_02437 [Dyadobacter sp. CECT 9623]
MKIKGFILSISFLWVEGMAIFPFILLKTKTPGRFLINHERIHLKQQLELGLILFYAWYFIEYLIRLAQYKKHYLAYLHISFEREAFQHQSDLEYLNKRPFWAFLRYLKR